MFSEYLAHRKRYNQPFDGKYDRNALPAAEPVFTTKKTEDFVKPTSPTLRPRFNEPTKVNMDQFTDRADLPMTYADKVIAGMYAQNLLAERNKLKLPTPNPTRFDDPTLIRRDRYTAKPAELLAKDPTDDVGLRRKPNINIPEPETVKNILARLGPNKTPFDDENVYKRKYTLKIFDDLDDNNGLKAKSPPATDVKPYRSIFDDYNYEAKRQQPQAIYVNGNNGIRYLALDQTTQKSSDKVTGEAEVTQKTVEVEENSVLSKRQIIIISILVLGLLTPILVVAFLKFKSGSKSDPTATDDDHLVDDESSPKAVEVIV